MEASDVAIWRLSWSLTGSVLAVSSGDNKVGGRNWGLGTGDCCLVWCLLRGIYAALTTTVLCQVRLFKQASDGTWGTVSTINEPSAR